MEKNLSDLEMDQMVQVVYPNGYRDPEIRGLYTTYDPENMTVGEFIESHYYRNMQRRDRNMIPVVRTIKPKPVEFNMHAFLRFTKTNQKLSEQWLNGMDRIFEYSEDYETLSSAIQTFRDYFDDYPDYEIEDSVVIDIFPEDSPRPVPEHMYASLFDGISHEELEAQQIRREHKYMVGMYRPIATFDSDNGKAKCPRCSGMINLLVSDHINHCPLCGQRIIIQSSDERE